MVLFNKHWHAPSIDIIDEIPLKLNNYSAEPEPSEISSLLLSCGVPTITGQTTVSASVIQYHFNLKSLKDFKGAKNATDAIAARLGRSVTFYSSQLCDFALLIERDKRDTVYIKHVLSTTIFKTCKSATIFVMGIDVDGAAVCEDISQMPHLLIAGTTGSGKSILLHNIICSMLFKGLPTELNFLMIDTKQVELTAYEGIPHLISPVVTSVADAVRVLSSVCELIDKRNGDIRRNKNVYKTLVIIIDELSDLMLSGGKEIERLIVRIAQLGRASKIHLIAATQHPITKVITSQIKVNMPARVALTVISSSASRVILDTNGAEKLAGRGDALLRIPGKNGLARFQSALIVSKDIESIVSYWRSKEARQRLRK